MKGRTNVGDVDLATATLHAASTAHVAAAVATSSVATTSSLESAAAAATRGHASALWGSEAWLGLAVLLAVSTV